MLWIVTKYVDNRVGFLGAMISVNTFIVEGVLNHLFYHYDTIILVDIHTYLSRR